MAVPAIAVEAGLAALTSLFGKKRKDIKLPDFGNLDPAEVQKAIEDYNKAAFGGAIGDIKTSLADQGILNPGSLTDAITRAHIAEGQNIASGQAGFATSDYAARRNAALDFQAQKYGIDLNLANQDFQQNQSMISSIGSAFGQYFANKEADRRFNRLLDYLTQNRQSGAESPVYGPTYLGPQGDFPGLDYGGGRGVPFYG